MGRNYWHVTAVTFSDTAQRSISLTVHHFVDLQECQAEDWKAHHRKECKLLQRQKEPLGALAHGVLRLWNLDSSGAENDPVVRDVSKLESHRQDFQQNSEWWQDIMEAVNDIRTLSTLAGKYIDQSSGGRIALLACKVFPPSLASRN